MRALLALLALLLALGAGTFVPGVLCEHAIPFRAAWFGSGCAGDAYVGGVVWCEVCGSWFVVRARVCGTHGSVDPTGSIVRDLNGRVETLGEGGAWQALRLQRFRMFMHITPRHLTPRVCARACPLRSLHRGRGADEQAVTVAHRGLTGCRGLHGRGARDLCTVPDHERRAHTQHHRIP